MRVIHLDDVFCSYPSRCDHLGTLPELLCFFWMAAIELAHSVARTFTRFCADWRSTILRLCRRAFSPVDGRDDGNLNPESADGRCPRLIEMAAGDSSPSVLADVLHAGPKLSAVARQRAWTSMQFTATKNR